LESVSAGMTKGAAWNVLFRVLDRSIGLLSTVVLARLLVPADFGVVALASSVVGLLGLLTDFGLDLALIQKPDAARRHFDTVWTLNVLFGAGIAALLVLLAYPMASLYGEPRLAPVMLGLAAAQVISSFQNVGLIAMRKDMAFDKEFRFLLIKRFATTFLATIPLAFIWRDYWALVGGTIAGSCVGLALSYRMHPYRPRPSLAAMREFLGFSKWMQLANIVAFVSGRAADFIIAKVVGSSALGSYAIAKEMARLPSTELAMPIHRGVYPGYAKLSGDPELLKRAYLRVLSVLVLVTLPAGIGLGLVAQPAVFVFLGGKWNDVVPLLPILSVNGVVAVSVSTSAYVYLARGTPRLTAIVVAIHAAVSLLIMLWLIPLWGARGAAWAVLAGTVATVPVNFRFLSGCLGLNVREIGSVVWRPLAATLAMAALVIAARPYWGTQAETFAANLFSLLVAAGVGAAAYCATVVLLWQLSARPEGAETFALERLKNLAAALGSRIRA
jgi:lipopolysaccharide exporter